MPPPEEDEETDESTAASENSGFLSPENDQLGLDDALEEMVAQDGELQELLEDLTPSATQLQFAGMVGEMVSAGHSDSNSANDLLMDIKGLKFAKNKVQPRHMMLLSLLIPLLIPLLLSLLSLLLSLSLSLLLPLLLWPPA